VPDDDREKRGVSRRALFGLGLNRALDELPAAARTARRRRPPERPDWDDLRASAVTPPSGAFDGQLAPVADGLLDAAGVERDTTVLEVGPGWADLVAGAAALGASLEPAEPTDPLPFGDDTFDVVTSAFGVGYADRRPELVAELFRVVRPGGVVALACWTRSGLMGAALGALDRLALPADAPDPTDWGRQEWMRAELEPFAGDAVEFELKVVGLEFPTSGAAWDSFAALPAPIAPAIAALDDDGRVELEREFTELLPHQRMPGPVWVSAQYQQIVARAPR
jgi:SAM-dependent methyltransferase